MARRNPHGPPLLREQTLLFSKKKKKNPHWRHAWFLLWDNGEILLQRTQHSRSHATNVRQRHSRVFWLLFLCVFWWSAHRRGWDVPEESLTFRRAFNHSYSTFSLQLCEDKTLCGSCTVTICVYLSLLVLLNRRLVVSATRQLLRKDVWGIKKTLKWIIGERRYICPIKTKSRKLQQVAQNQLWYFIQDKMCIFDWDLEKAFDAPFIAQRLCRHVHRLVGELNHCLSAAT